MTAAAIPRLILETLEARHPKTACPSEIARLVEPKAWRPLMLPVREAAVKLAKRGRIDITQSGKKIDVSAIKGPIRLRLAAAVDVYRKTDFRDHPDNYEIGKGEQGVRTAEPYKSELLPLWRFNTEAIAQSSSKALYRAFLAYAREGDFVGMDMARKFIQLGFTRARRYANHRTGRKYDAQGEVAARELDDEKAKAATVFFAMWKLVERNPVYLKARAAHRARAKR